MKLNEEHLHNTITILVAEEDQSLNRIYKSHLVQQGYRVITSLSYDEALLILASEPIDIMLVDANLGGRKGIELKKNIPDMAKDKHVPFILMANRESPDILQACISLGVDDFLPKPINPLLLNVKIKSLIYHVRMSNIVSHQNKQLTDLLNKSDLEKQMVSHLMNNHLLSKQTSQVKGLEYFIQPTDDFSGDLIVARYAPSGNVFIMHVDATGHGLTATVTLMPVVTIFKAMVEKGYRLESIIREINTSLAKQLPFDRFVAASLVEVDLNHGTLRVWNGGMPGLCLLDDENRIIQQFESKYMALGILSSKEFISRAESIKLPIRAKLVGYSDAVIEQRDLLGYPFGIGRLRLALRQSYSNSLEHILSALIEHCGDNRFDDDLSFYQFNVEQAVQAHQALYLTDHVTHTLEEIPPFTWSLVLVGKQIGKQELPSQCNQFLADMGFHHTFCQRVFTILTELVTNAVDHGLLKLTSVLKAGEEGFLTYYEERDKRLAELSKKDHLTLSLNWFEDEQGPCMHLEVQDSGEGYELESLEKEQTKGEYEFGRGLALVRQLASEVCIQHQGTHVIVTLR